MKRRINRYKRETGTQYILIATIAGLLVLSGAKTIYIVQKVNLVHKGLSLYEHKTWIEAEEMMQQTKNYDGFRYKEKDVDNVLQELNWITRYKDELAVLYEAIRQSEDSKDYVGFSGARRNYEALGFHNLEDWKQEYLLERYPINEAITSAWVSFKGYMQSLLNHPSQNNSYNWAKEKIFEVPEQYFSSDKEEAILKLFKNGDNRLYEQISLHFHQLTDTFEAFNKIYETNDKYGYETEWLTDRIKGFIKENLLKESLPVDELALEEIRNHPKVYKLSGGTEASLPVFRETEKQIKTFSDSIEGYRKQAHKAYRDEQVEEIVNDFLKNKEKEISVLVAAHYYEEAISWYKALGTLKNDSEEIEQINRLKFYEEPERLLEPKASQYSFYQVGEKGLQADKYLIAINTQNSSLEVYKLIGNPKEYTNNQMSVSLADIGLEDIDYSLLEQVSVSGELILLKLPDKEKQMIKVIKVGKEEIDSVFDMDGDDIKISSNLRTIEVKNPMGEASLFSYTYQYDGESYIEQQQEVIEVSLGDANLQTRVGQIVKFECYYPEIFPNEIITVYNFEEQTYFPDQGADLDLEEGMMLMEGKYQIIGKITGVSTYYDEALQMEMIRPMIEVLQVEER